MRYFNISYKFLGKEIEKLPRLHSTISRCSNKIADAIKATTMPDIIKQKFIVDWQIYRYSYALSIVLECPKMDAQTNITCYTNKECYETLRCSIQTS